MLTVTGFLARAPGHATSATLGLVGLVIAAAALLWWRPRREAGPSLLREGWPVALLVALAFSIPFAISGRWGIIGVGFNNDLGLHLAWAEWLRSGLGPAPEAGYPLGPHALAAAIAALPGIGLGQAFVGEIFAIGILTALDRADRARRSRAGAPGARRGPGRDPLPRRLLLRPGRLQGDRRGALRPRLRPPPPQPRAPAARRASGAPALGAAIVGLALVTGIFFSYSFAGLAWPVAIFALWALTLPAAAAGAGAAGLAVDPAPAGDAADRSSCSPASRC